MGLGLPSSQHTGSAEGSKRCQLRSTRERVRFSAPYRAILRGHGLDLRFRILQANLQAAHRLALKAAGCPVVWDTRGWSEICRKCLAYFGWAPTSAWQWAHQGLNASFSLHRGNLSWDRAKVEHFLRESFRHWHFLKWIAKDRRDSRECAGVGYDTARKWATDDRCCFMHLSGSTVSPAAYDRMLQRQVQDCPFCADREWEKGVIRPKATMDHLLWDCRGLEDECRSVLGALPPQFSARLSALQRRLGGPAGRANDVLIRQWHLAVRKKILEHRYGA